ncbi:MAG: RNA pseudouridine synthase [Bacteroidota bacterium]
MTQVTPSKLIVARHGEFWVLRKPAGLLSQPSEVERSSLLTLVEDHLGLKFHLHSRLDRPVSGLIVASGRIKKVELPIIQKTYVAITTKASDHEGTIHGYISRDGQKRRALYTDRQSPGFRPCELTYRVVESLERYDIVAITLNQGRFHQIRVQMASVGRVIKGDVKYGARRGYRDRSIDLHSAQVQFADGTSFTTLAEREGELWRLADTYIGQL